MRQSSRWLASLPVRHADDSSVPVPESPGAEPVRVGAAPAAGHVDAEQREHDHHDDAGGAAADRQAPSAASAAPVLDLSWVEASPGAKAHGGDPTGRRRRATRSRRARARRRPRTAGRGEVRQQRERRAGVLAAQAEDVVVARPERLAGPVGVGGAGARAQRDEPRRPAHSRPSTVAGRGGAPRRPSPSRAGASSGCPRRGRGRRGPAGVVAQAELVAHVDQREAAEGERHGVQQQHAAHARGRRRASPLERVEPGQRRRGAADARLAVGLGLEARAARERAREVAGEEVAEEAPVQVRVLADGARVLVGDRPADVVVAAHVGHPAGAGRDGRHRPQRLRQQRRRAARRASSTAAP